MSIKSKVLLAGGALAIIVPALASQNTLATRTWGWSPSYSSYGWSDRGNRYEDRAVQRASWSDGGTRWREVRDDPRDWRSEPASRTALYDRHDRYEPARTWSDDRDGYRSAGYTSATLYDRYDGNGRYDRFDRSDRYDTDDRYRPNYRERWIDTDARWRDEPVRRRYERFEVDRYRPWRTYRNYRTYGSYHRWHHERASRYWRPGYFWQSRERAYVPWYERSRAINQALADRPYRNGYYNPVGGYFVKLHNSRGYHGYGGEGLNDLSDPKRSLRTAADQKVFWEALASRN